MANTANSQATENQKEDEKKDSETLTFTFLNTGETSKTGTIAYPSALRSINGQVDYLMFKFKIYTPPFKAQSTAAGGTYAGYNASALELKDDRELPTILMYMPEDVQAEYGTDWGAKSIQNITASILRTVAGNNLNDLFGNIQKSASDAMNGADIKITKEALKALQDNGQGEGLGVNDILGSTRGVIVNPNTELLFNGFDLRTFSLNFKMVARNGDEAKDIRDIVTAFKMAMLPRLDERKSANDQDKFTDVGPDDKQINGVDRTSFIGVPDLVEIKVMQGSSEHPFISQWKPCAITSLNVNYTADGAYATYEDGEPVAVTMSLGLSEIKLIYREDIRFGGPSF